MNDERTEIPAETTADARSVWARIWSHPILEFRGSDNQSLPLKIWLLIALGTGILAWLLAPLEPFFTLIPPLLVIAIAVVPFAHWQSSWNEDSRRAQWLERIFVFSVIGGLTIAVWGFLFRTHTPINSGDHAIMIGRAQEFYQGLTEGRWLHWTNDYQAGDSLGDLYPMFANILTAIAHVLSPPGTTFEMSYTFVAVWAWWLRGVAVYFLARRVAGPWISMALALGALLDVGDDVWDGMWNGAIYWGMIHNNIALSIGAIGACFQLDLLKKVTSFRFIACVLCIALTAFAHPLGVLFASVSTASILLGTLLTGEGRKNGYWAFAASVLGIFISAPYIIPFAHAHKVMGYNNSIPGLDYRALGRGLLDGYYPTTSFTAFIGFGLIAVSAAVLTPELGVRIPALCAILFWTLTLTPLIVQIRLLDYVPSFLDGQQRRMLTVLKIAAVPSLAWGLSRIYSTLNFNQSLRVRPVLARLVVLGLLLMGPGRAIAVASSELVTALRDQVPKRAEGERPHAGPDHEAIFGRLAELRKVDPSQTMWRAAILWRKRARHAAWGEGFNTGVPVVDPNNVSSNFLKFRPREMTPQGFQDWNIRYAITDYASAPFQGLKEVMRSGELTLWEFEGYDPRYVVGPPNLNVRNLKFDGDTISFDISGTGPNGADVNLRTAWFPRWRAEQDGNPVPVVARLPRPDARASQDQIGLHLRDGHVTLKCNGWMPRALFPGWVFGALGILGLVLAGKERRRADAEEKLRKAIARVREHIERSKERIAGKVRVWHWGLVGIAVLALGLLVWMRGTTRLAIPPIEGFTGPKIALRHAQGDVKRCHGEWWHAEYSCGKHGSVKSWLGTDPLRDHSGEFHKQWPGTIVRVSQAGDAIELTYGRVRWKRGFNIKVATHGQFDLSLDVGGVAVAPQRINGEMQLDIPAPESVTSPARVTLKFKSLINSGHVVFRAHTY